MYRYIGIQEEGPRLPLWGDRFGFFFFFFFPPFFAGVRGHSREQPTPPLILGGVNPLRAPQPLPILNPSNFVPKNGFPVVKGLTSVLEPEKSLPVDVPKFK